MKLASRRTSAGRHVASAAEQPETGQFSCRLPDERNSAPQQEGGQEPVGIRCWCAFGRFAKLALLLSMFLLMFNGTPWMQRAAGRPDGADLLFAGIQGECPEWVNRALTAGVSVNARNSQGETPLYWATQVGNEALVRRLISAGADVEAQEEYGVTALMVASCCGRIGVMRILLDAGADVNHMSNMGGALHWAATHAHLDALDLLLERGADINARNHEGHTPLMTAVFSREITTIRRLVAAGADVNLMDYDGRTAHMHAVSEGETGSVEILGELNGFDSPARPAEPRPSGDFMRQ